MHIYHTSLSLCLCIGVLMCMCVKYAHTHTQPCTRVIYLPASALSLSLCSLSDTNRNAIELSSFVTTNRKSEVSPVCTLKLYYRGERRMDSVLFCCSDFCFTLLPPSCSLRWLEFCASHCLSLSLLLTSNVFSFHVLPVAFSYVVKTVSPLNTNSLCRIRRKILYFSFLAGRTLRYRCWGIFMIMTG